MAEALGLLTKLCRSKPDSCAIQVSIAVENGLWICHHVWAARDTIAALAAHPLEGIVQQGGMVAMVLQIVLHFHVMEW